MPIVVKVLSKADYAAWLAAQKAAGRSGSRTGAGSDAVQVPTSPAG
jgi:heme/copper-type cytochrome/quinol oxidase subunit 2